MTRQSKTGIPSRRTYLTDDGVIPISPQVAVMFGINAAAFLQQLHFLLSSAKEDGKLYNYVDGQWWVYYSYPNWTKKLPWLKPKTVQRIAADLSKSGVIHTRINPHKTWDRSLWYRLDYDAFHKLLDGAHPSEQSDQMPSGHFDQMDADNVSRSNRTESPDVNITTSNDLNNDSAAATQSAPVSKRSKKNKPVDPNAAAISAIIDAWVKSSGSLSGNIFANKTIRASALNMHTAGITPDDVTEYVKEQRRDAWHASRIVSFAKVADNVLGWKASRQPHIVEAEDTAPVHTPSTIAPDTKVIGDMTAAEFDALTDAERQAQIDLKLASIAGRIVGTEGGRRGREAARNELDELNKSA
jgi:hypothetical protein